MDLKEQIINDIQDNPIILFMKGNREMPQCGFSARVVEILNSCDVEFATVRAPISGQISDRRVDVGNLVSGENGAGASLLTTINAVDPVYFEFSGSEALFLKARREGLDNVFARHRPGGAAQRGQVHPLQPPHQPADRHRAGSAGSDPGPPLPGRRGARPPVHRHRHRGI